MLLFLQTVLIYVTVGSE